MRILSIVTLPQSAPRIPTQEAIDETVALIDELTKAGSLVDAGGTWPGLLETRITRRGGDYTVVDGPFSEAKEVVGGYFLIDVPDRAAAIALTRRFLEISGDATWNLHEIVPGPADDA